MADEKEKVSGDPKDVKAAAAAEKAAAKVKRAEFRHTDSGYSLAVQRGDDPVIADRYVKGLEGLFEKADELLAEGFEVFVEGKAYLAE